VSSSETPEARLARWTERDVAIGLVAEVEQLRAAIAQRDREIADLRERAAQLGLRMTALELERNRLSHLIARAERAPIARRVIVRCRALVARLLPR
jgi:hypothetical protein